MKKYVKITLVLTFILTFGFLIEAKEKLEVDSRCNSDFTQELNFKQGCYLDGNSSNCLMLGGLKVLAGAGVGSFVGKAAESILNKQTPEVRKRFLAAVSEIRGEGAMSRKAWSQLTELRNKKVVEMTKGKYQTYEEMAAAWMGPPRRERRNEYSAEELKLRDQYYEGDAAATAEFRKLAATELDIELKAVMLKISEGSSDATALQMQRIEEKIGKVFPEEYAKLKPFYDKIRSLDQQYSKMLSGDSSSNFPEKLRKLEVEIHRTTDDMIEMVQNPKTGSPKLKLTYSLLSDGFFMTRTRMSRAVIFQSARKTIEAERAENAGPRKNFSKKGAAAGALFESGAEVGKSLAGQIDVRVCKKDYGLSDEEVEFLTNEHWFVPAKADKKNGRGCDALTLNNPGTTLAELEARFGGVPKGICNLLKHESKKLDELLGDAGSIPNNSCGGTVDANYSLTKDDPVNPLFVNNAGKEIFEFRTAEKMTYKAPLRAGDAYPDLRFAKAFDSSGKEILSESVKFQIFYSKIHPANTPELKPETADVKFDSNPNSHNGKLFAEMKIAAHKARINHAVSTSVCMMADEPPATIVPAAKAVVAPGAEK